jgi:LuxR family maltose regulon positive regulatory protein
VDLGAVAYQRDELDIALRQVTEGIALCRPLAYTPPLAAGLVTLAWIRQVTGDPAGALEAIDEAGQAAPGPAGLLNPVPAQRARLLLAQGDLAAAARWTEEQGLAADDEPDYRGERGHLVLTRVLLAQGQLGPALALLDRVHAAAAAQDRTGSLIEAGALRALALAASGDEAGAVAVLAETLMLACPQGMSGSSPTRARRWPRCSGSSSRPSAPAGRPRTCRSATWPGCGAPSMPGRPRQIPVGTPPCPASSIR